MVALWYVMDILTQYLPVERMPNTVCAAVSFTVLPPDMCRDAFVLRVQLYGADTFSVIDGNDYGTASECLNASFGAF